MRTTTDRRAALLARAGIDPIRVDKRPLGEIMEDEIPYARFDRNDQIAQRVGFKNLNEWIYGERK